MAEGAASRPSGAIDLNPAGRGWLVHNGVVVNHASLVRQYRLAPSTACDSEVLGLLMARIPGALGRRAARTAEVAEGRLAILGVWPNPARLLIVRHGNPLCFGETGGGFYFGSLPEELPGKVAAITDEYAGVLVFDRGRLRHTAYSIRTYPPTIREIRIRFGIRSPNGVVCHLRALRRHEVIDWVPKSARTLRIISQASQN